MNEVFTLQRDWVEEILRTTIEKKVPAIMSYLSNGKGRIAKVLLTNLGVNSLNVKGTRSKKQPHPISLKVSQTVGISFKHSFGKCVFDTTVVGFEPSSEPTHGGTIILAVPDWIKAVHRRSKFRVDVPKSFKVNVVLWHRGGRFRKKSVIWAPVREPRDYFQGRLVNISADGAQIVVPYYEGVIQGHFGIQKPVFKKGQFIGLRFTPMPYQTSLMFNARIRKILQTSDNKSISIDMQIIGLDSTPQGRQVLSRLVETVKQYYQINQSNAKQQDVLGEPAPRGKPAISAEKGAFRIPEVSRKMSTASKYRTRWNISGEYERLKNNILSLNSERAVKTIMVTSSVSKEGCSTVVSNLAMTLAKNSSLNVLLIDGNFRHPTLHLAFRVENKTGLSDLILGNVDISEAIKKTNLPNLSVITSGDFRGNPIEVLESINLKGLTVRLEGQFDYIILDSAPINTYADASILASQVDGVILVVHAGRTRWEVVQNAKRQLEMVHASISGVVLNRKKYVIPKFLYKRL